MHDTIPTCSSLSVCPAGSELADRVGVGISNQHGRRQDRGQPGWEYDSRPLGVRLRWVALLSNDRNVALQSSVEREMPGVAPAGRGTQGTALIYI